MTKFTTGETIEVRNTAVNRSSVTWRHRIGTKVVAERVSATGTVTIAGIRGSWGTDRFASIARAEEIKIGTYIISLQKPDGTLLPASEPKKYVSDAQANKIAELMAAKHGGKFVVFRAVGEYEMPQAKPTYRAL